MREPMGLERRADFGETQGKQIRKNELSSGGDLSRLSTKTRTPYKKDQKQYEKDGLLTDLVNLVRESVGKPSNKVFSSSVGEVKSWIMGPV